MTFKRINEFGQSRTPFLFISDFHAKNIHVVELDALGDIEFSISEHTQKISHNNKLAKNPVSFESYKKKFDFVQEKIRCGDTYLLNLTQPTKIELELSLQEIFKQTNANYKLRFQDKFVCFSPECFVKIKDNKIHTFPMKGTIDASVENARVKILADAKELAEHIMVVDLLRNDLSIKAVNVKVEDFRYITTVASNEKTLLQVSSHISGELQQNWHEHLGDILESLLPAGSISGTPKRSTCQIIEQIEGYERGYFSGVFGVYDGESFDSGVMIRFIEKIDNGYVYKSGGGITLDSNALQEYNELLDKVYLP